MFKWEYHLVVLSQTAAWNVRMLQILPHAWVKEMLNNVQKMRLEQSVEKNNDVEISFSIRKFWFLHKKPTHLIAKWVINVTMIQHFEIMVVFGYIFVVFIRIRWSYHDKSEVMIPSGSGATHKNSKLKGLWCTKYVTLVFL